MRFASGDRRGNGLERCSCIASCPPHKRRKNNGRQVNVFGLNANTLPGQLHRALLAFRVVRTKYRPQQNAFRPRSDGSVFKTRVRVLHSNLR